MEHFAIFLMLAQATVGDCPAEGACGIDIAARKDLHRYDDEVRKAEARLRGIIHDPRRADNLSLEPRTVAAVEAVLTTWRPVMEAECGLYGAAVGGSEDWKTAYRDLCEGDELQQRAVTIRGATVCIDKRWPIPYPTGSYPQMCLETLTPSISPKQYHPND